MSAVTIVLPIIAIVVSVLALLKTLFDLHVVRLFMKCFSNDEVLQEAQKLELWGTLEWSVGSCNNDQCKHSVMMTIVLGRVVLLDVGLLDMGPGRLRTHRDVGPCACNNDLCEFGHYAWMENSKARSRGIIIRTTWLKPRHWRLYVNLFKNKKSANASNEYSQWQMALRNIKRMNSLQAYWVVLARNADMAGNAENTGMTTMQLCTKILAKTLYTYNIIGEYIVKRKHFVYTTVNEQIIVEMKLQHDKERTIVEEHTVVCFLCAALTEDNKPTIVEEIQAAIRCEHDNTPIMCPYCATMVEQIKTAMKNNNEPTIVEEIQAAMKFEHNTELDVVWRNAMLDAMKNKLSRVVQILSYYRPYNLNLDVKIRQKAQIEILEIEYEMETMLEDIDKKLGRTTDCWEKSDIYRMFSSKWNIMQLVLTCEQGKPMSMHAIITTNRHETSLENILAESLNYANVTFGEPSQVVQSLMELIRLRTYEEAAITDTIASWKHKHVTQLAMTTSHQEHVDAIFSQQLNGLLKTERTNRTYGLHTLDDAYRPVNKKAKTKTLTIHLGGKDGMVLSNTTTRSPNSKDMENIVSIYMKEMIITKHSPNGTLRLGWGSHKTVEQCTIQVGCCQNLLTATATPETSSDNLDKDKLLFHNAVLLLPEDITEKLYSLGLLTSVHGTSSGVSYHVPKRMANSLTLEVEIKQTGLELLDSVGGGSAGGTAQ